MSKTLTVESVSASYVRIIAASEQIDAPAKWRWARDLSTLMDSIADKRERTVASDLIGAEVAKGIGREKPYAGSWVRLHIAAYKKFESGLQSPADFRQFLLLASGNASKEAKKAQEAVSSLTDEQSDGTGVQPERANQLNRLRKLVKSMRAEFTADEIRAAVEESL